MNHVPQTSQFTCPCCRGFIGEAAPVEFVRDSITKPTLKKMFERLSTKRGHNVRREALINACYEDDIDGGPDEAEKAFRVNLHNLRKHVEPFGWHIECTGGRGRGQFGGGFYRLIPAEVTA